MLEQANILLADKKFKKAKKEYLACIDQEQNKAPIYFGLATSHYYLHEYHDAEIYARKALDIDSNLYKAHLILAYIYARQRKFMESEDEVETALKLSPSDSETLAFAGGIFVAQKKLDRGLDALHKAQELDPNDWLVHSNLGFAYSVRKDYKNAAKAFFKSLRLKRSFSTLLSLFIALISTNEFTFVFSWLLGIVILVGLSIRSLTLLMFPGVFFILAGILLIVDKQIRGLWIIFVGLLPLLLYYLLR